MKLIFLLLTWEAFYYCYDAFVISNFNANKRFSNKLNVIINQKQDLSGNLLSKKQTIKEKAADLLISSVFKIRPLFQIARDKARNSMVERGSQIGVNWQENINQYQNHMGELQDRFNVLSSASISYPDYYLKPFHAYDDGNLSWQAAMEVESAAITVHSQIYNRLPTELDPNGDYTLRDRFHKNMVTILSKRNFQPRKILDIGCSTGLSTLKLHETFPKSDIIGIDLSSYMLAVADYQLHTNPTLASSAKDRITYMQRAGEDTGLGKDDVDLVTLSLVSHELPQSATKEIISEAYKVLPNGGAISIMDMNPDSIAFKKVASNPFAFAAFKSTEPWIQEYVTLDLYHTLQQIGFNNIEMIENSPRHRTIVAYK